MLRPRGTTTGRAALGHDVVLRAHQHPPRRAPVRPDRPLLPWGIAFGRLDADSARTVLDLAHDGRTATHLMRGHSALDPPAQVAELHARAAVGYDGLAPLRVDVQPGPADRARALVEAQDQGRHLEVALRRTRVDVVASCGHAPEPVERWTVEAIRPCPPGP